ncbi:TlpA disulfide reductase family protein [Bacteroides sp. L10-4]|uniref:TlpA family protein disulfide reductase n=2 Tax=Bacteroides TaxID=816 RepID=UPI001595F722|nr:TlpA disulfide reductase family protein [Bacteroides sp. L10-4]NVK92034.1 TlpA family protein disulfide reductase [Bacteroides sp. L10-4]
MNFRYFYILLLLTFFPSVSAQKAVITFIADKDCEIITYAPIDGEYNTKIPSSRLATTKNQLVTYTTEISSYTFVYCQFPQYQKSCDIILFPNDSVQISISESGIKFQGNNHAGQQYFYDNARKKPFLEKSLKMQQIAIEYIEQKRSIHSIIPAIIDSLHLAAHIEDIEKLPLTSNTTPEFAKVLKAEREMFYYGNIMDLIGYLRQSSKKYEHIAKDSLEIEEIANGIFQKYPLKYEYLKYSSLIYILKYISYYYNDKECPEGYDPETFGPYKAYLYAPEDMQPGLLGGACMVQLKYNSGEMNLSKLKKFFNEKFPKSEYAAIINQRVQEETDSSNETTDNSYFIKERIDSLSQLRDIKELKGKYLFIDLWASWCMPCRAEFSHKSKLEELLNAYGNIATVYISIDDEKQEKAWLNCVKYYKLEGYHLRATFALQEDIKKNIYGKEQFEIPRYLLIGPEGKIINNDLPRPSEYPQLKEALGLVIK